MISRLCSVAAFTRSLIPSSLKAMRICRAVGVEKLKSVAPIAVTEVASFFRAVSAAALSFSFSSATVTDPPSRCMVAMPILALRNSLRLWDARIWRRSRIKEAASTSRTRCDPPRRSRPSVTCCLGRTLGRRASCSAVKRLGKAARMPNRMVTAYMAMRRPVTCMTVSLSSGCKDGSVGIVLDRENGQGSWVSATITPFDGLAGGKTNQCRADRRQDGNISAPRIGFVRVYEPDSLHGIARRIAVIYGGLHPDRRLLRRLKRDVRAAQFRQQECGDIGRIPDCALGDAANSVIVHRCDGDRGLVR